MSSIYEYRPTSGLKHERHWKEMPAQHIIGPVKKVLKAGAVRVVFAGTEWRRRTS